MDPASKIKRQITKQNKEIGEIEAELDGLRKSMESHENRLLLAKTFREGLEAALKSFDPSGAEGPDAPALTELRKGSRLDKVFQLLSQSRKPMHINEILKSLQMDVNKKNRQSLSGSINRLARNGAHFEKTAPNTYTSIGNEKAVAGEDAGSSLKVEEPKSSHRHNPALQRAIRDAINQTATGQHEGNNSVLM